MKRLDIINVSLRLLKLQRDEALTKNDSAMILMRSLDHTQEEKRKLEDELEACDTSGENVKDDVIITTMMQTWIIGNFLT